MSLGDRINKLQNQPRSFSKTSLFMMSMGLFGIVALNGILSYEIIRKFYVVPCERFDARSYENKDPYPDIVQRTIPKIQDWIEATDGNDSTQARTIQEPTDASQQCLDECFAFLRNHTSTVGTSPAIIEDILDQMNLRQIPMVNYYMRDYLSRPVSWLSIADQSLTCLGKSITVTKMACTLRNALNVCASNTSSELEYAVNIAVVIEVLTKALLTDLETLIQIFDLLLDKPVSKNTTQFLRDKTDGIAYSMKHTSTAVAENKVLPSRDALRINILEAVLEALEQDLSSNARIGLDLAVGVLFSSTVSNHQLEFNIGRPWVDTYIGWNAEFIIKSGIHLGNIGKLLIPSVSCSLESDKAGSFLFARVISLALSLKVTGIRIVVPGQGSDIRDAFARESLDDVVPIPRATRQQIQSMVAELCDGNHCRIGGDRKVSDPLLIANLSDEDFNVFYGFVVMLTVIFAGYGMELLVLLLFLRRRGWSSSTEKYWKLGQFVFPWFACMTLGLAFRQNFIALLTLVPGLWKFGFPEVVSYINYSWYGPDQSFWSRIAGFLNGVGTILHHSAASLLIVMLLMEVINPDREIVTPILFLVVQQWFVLLAYLNVPLYVSLELMLEVAFQFTVISGLERITGNHWTAGMAALLMLVAHELYLTAAAIELVCCSESGYLAAEQQFSVNQSQDATPKNGEQDHQDHEELFF